MKRELGSRLPYPVLEMLRKFGVHIRIARLKRGVTADAMAGTLGIHRSTYGKVEGGDPMVALGIYAAALYELGFGTPFGEVADPRRDEVGLLLDLERLPKRARLTRSQSATLPLARIADGKRPMVDRTLRIGVIGAMSGPYALWGLVSKHAAEATAEMYNQQGGALIGRERYRIEIVACDDRLDPAAAVSAAERLTRTEGIRYIIGPNVEQTIASTTPVAEKNASMLFPYSFTRSYYLPPHENAVLGQVAGYQAWPIIFGHLREMEGVRAISVLAPSTPEGRRQRGEAISAAKHLGLQVLSGNRTYEPGSPRLSEAVTASIRDRPDLLVLSNLAPTDAPRLIRLARERGFDGFFATEAAQDINVLVEEAGEAANRLITLGGASTPETQTPYMKTFIARYRKRAGAWHDEAGTKAYALEFILGTLQVAGEKAVDDINIFKRAIPSFAMSNPFVKGQPELRYVGTSYFHQRRQMGVPMVVNAVRDGAFKPVFVGSVD